MFKRTFRFRGAGMWKKSCTSYVGPQLKFAIPVMNPYLNSWQRYSRKSSTQGHENRTKHKNQSYEDRCKFLNITNFNQRRIKNFDQRYNFFNNRIATKWNQLPNKIISGTSLNSFKNKFDVYLCGEHTKLPKAAIYC